MKDETKPSRLLLVMADDFGIGPEVNRGIVELAAAGLISGTTVLVNSEYAAAGVEAWKRARPEADLGWHPCLTMGRPILPAAEVRSLVDGNGDFFKLDEFARRYRHGQIAGEEIEREFAGQLKRFQEMTGRMSAVVNCHHHVHVFPRVGAALRAALGGLRPYLRRNHETWNSLRRMGGERLKRVFISFLGTRAAKIQARDRFPGNDELLGICDMNQVPGDDFFAQWLDASTGNMVELMTHPGYYDATIMGRDSDAAASQLERRVKEMELLRGAGMKEAIKRNGLVMGRVEDVAGGGE